MKIYKHNGFLRLVLMSCISLGMCHLSFGQCDYIVTFKVGSQSLKTCSVSTTPTNDIVINCDSNPLSLCIGDELEISFNPAVTSDPYRAYKIFQKTINSQNQIIYNTISDFSETMTNNTIIVDNSWEGDYKIKPSCSNGSDGRDIFFSINLFNPIIQYSPSDATIPCGDNPFVTVTVDGASNATYSWQNSTSITKTATYNVAGNYNVTVTSNSGSCNEVLEVNINEPDYPTVAIEEKEGEDFKKLCQGTPFNLSVNRETEVGYQWLVDDEPATPQFQGNKIIVDVDTENTGIVNYKIVATDNNNRCESVDSLQIEVLEKPTLIIRSDDDTTIDNILRICEGIDTTLKASGANSYEWFDEEFILSNDAQLELINPESGEIKLKGTSDNSCQDSTTFTLIVAEKPDLSMTTISTSVCVGETTSAITLNNSYTWEVQETRNVIRPSVMEGSGTIPPNEYMLEAGQNMGWISYSVQNGAGCEEIININVLSTNGNNAFVPKVFTPNGDGVNDTWDITVKDVSISTITLFDRNGRKVAELLGNQNWDGGSCPDGTYFYVIEYDGDVKNQKGWMSIIR